MNDPLLTIALIALVGVGLAALGPVRTPERDATTAALSRSRDRIRELLDAKRVREEAEECGPCERADDVRGPWLYRNGASLDDRVLAMLDRKRSRTMTLRHADVADGQRFVYLPGAYCLTRDGDAAVLALVDEDPATAPVAAKVTALRHGWRVLFPMATEHFLGDDGQHHAARRFYVERAA